MAVMYTQYTELKYKMFDEGVTGLQTNHKTIKFIENIIQFYIEEDMFIECDQLFYRKEYYERNIGINFYN